MEAIKIRGGHGPEWYIQQDIIRMLTLKGWFVKSTHGNSLQQGFPDLYACHPRYGQRWIEVKNPKKYEFTAAQLEDFPRISQGGGIWILVAATEDEYLKLFKEQNWYVYYALVHSYHGHK